MTSSNCLRVALVASSTLAILTTPLRAQSDSYRSDRPSTVMSLMAGLGRSGSGNGIAAAFGLSIPSGRFFLVEPGIGFFRYTSEFGEHIAYILPEVSLQFQVPSGAVRPYAGVGAGFSEYSSGRGSTYGTLHAAAGVRVRIAGGYGLRAEVRTRTIDPFRLNTTGFMLGLSWRVGSS